MSKHNWTEESTQELLGLVGTDTDEIVSKETILQAVEDIEGTDVRNITGKLRSLGYSCVSMAKAAKGSTFTEDEGAALAQFAQDNAGNLTYAEMAVNFDGGKFSTRQIQGKLLSMDLSHVAKPTEKPESVKQYTDEQEAEFISLANHGNCIEDIAEAMGKEVKSARGKALSLLRKGEIENIPVTRDKVEQSHVDVFAELNVGEMTVEEISQATDKSTIGVKTTLTRRGLDCIDHKGAARRAKLEAKKAAAED